MGLLDIYSAINAGGVGRYGASDANNGGAPGTVRDKVEQQMTGHRQNALALLGNDFSAPQPQNALSVPNTPQHPQNNALRPQIATMDPTQFMVARGPGQKLAFS
jgi:hypothetical protein